MKRIVLGLATLAAAAAAASFAGAAAGGEGKVTICHMTSSASNPYVVITISTAALQKHLDHHGDLYFRDGSCDTSAPLDSTGDSTL